MSSVQCHFCSRSNSVDALFCDVCGGQLNLAPCPHCDGVNEVTATVCHACNGDLVATTVERGLGAGPFGESGSEFGGFEARPEQIGTPSAASERPIGSSRARPAADAAAGSRIERVADLIRQAPLDVLARYSAHRARHSDEGDNTRSEPGKVYIGSAPAVQPRDRGAFGMAIVDFARQAEEGPPEHTKVDAEPDHAAPAETTVQPMPAARRTLTANAASFFTRRWIAAAAVAGVALTGGVLLLYDPSSSTPVHSTASVGTAAPANAVPSTQSGAPVEPGALQGEAAAIPSVPPEQGAASAEREPAPASPITQTTQAAAPSDTATISQRVDPPPPRARVQSSGGRGTVAKPSQTAACTEGVVALGLCRSAGEAQPPARIRSANVRQAAKNEAGCNEAAAALALCTPITTSGKD
jgi:hypothetical protein